MKTVPLRQLLREPIKIKRWTRAGQTVQVNDNGRPLWIIRSAAEIPQEEDVARRKAIEEMFEELSSEPVASISLAKIVKDSRR
jgi:hypothetical protein